MAKQLEGKVALVSGSAHARGQGASHAALLAAEGAAVICSDILDEEGQQIADAIREDGGEAIYQRLDVRRNEDWVAAVALAEERYGKLDILVNNAGVCGVAGIDECSDEEWNDGLATNLTGPFLGMRAAIPAMRRAGAGAITNTCSVFGLRGLWGYAAYASSKAGLVNLTRSAAVQYGPENIRVNAICPGCVDTPMLDEEMAHFADQGVTVQSWLDENQPIARAAAPREISELVLYLVSERASLVNGAVMCLDGGYMAR